MRRRLRTLAELAAALWLSASPAASPQPANGSITGTVRDGSGHLLPLARVTVVAAATGLARVATTGPEGRYVVVGLPPGEYAVRVELDGFRIEASTGWAVAAAARLTADLTLTPLDPAEILSAEAPGRGADRASGETARTLPREQLDALALNGRRSIEWMAMVPGTPQPTTAALERLTGLAIDTSFNGSRENSSLVTLDGGFNLDAGSNNSQASHIGAEFVDHVTVTTSSASAEFGRQSGATVNLVTRAGTNRFGGSAFEYLRRNALDANGYFANLRGIEKRSPTFDNFGAAFGGPLVKNRVFFFGGIEWKRVRRTSSLSLRSLPTSAMRRGDLGALPIHLKNPYTGGEFPNNVIPSSLITPDGRAIANVYAAMASLAVSYDDSKPADNAVFEQVTPFDFRQEMLRFDAHAGAAHRLTTRLVFEDDSLLAPSGSLINSQLPTVPTERTRPGRNIQVTHAWTVAHHLVNDARLNIAGHGQEIRPTGDAWKRATYGFAFTQLYDGGAYESSIPNVNVGSFASFRGASGTLSSPTSDYSFGDTLTWVKGAHTVKAGGQFVTNRKDQNGRSNYAGTVSFSTSSTLTTGHAFADALLGNFRRYEEAQLDPIGSFRFTEADAFVSDAWHVSDRLGLEAGLRYSWQTPTITVGNNTTSFDPSRYQASDAVLMNTDGTIVPGAGNRFNGLVRPGEVPASQLAHVPNASSPLVRQVPFARSRGYYRNQHLVAPRLSLAWTPGRSAATVVRAGIGLSYDHPEGNLHYALPNNPPFVLSATYENGNLSRPASATPAALAPWAAIASIDPDLQAARVWNWSLGTQREFPWEGLFADVAYVGNAGTHLLRQPDINAPTFADLTRNVALKYSTDYWRPYKGYSAIRMFVSDGRSDYHALQVRVGRRRGTLRFTANYTLSKSNDTASTNTDGVDPGTADQRYYYGPSAHDRRHVLVVSGTWQLPFSANTTGGWGLAAGWEISTIWRVQSGAPFSVTGLTAIGTRRADYLGGDPYAFSVDRAGGVVTWLDSGRFALAPATRPGNSGRNAFVGPAFQGCDVSLRKTFGRARVRVQLEADFFNAFNQVRFNNPASSLTGSTPFGTITSAAPARTVQIGLRLLF